jgi:hypothetical protein
MGSLRPGRTAADWKASAAAAGSTLEPNHCLEAKDHEDHGEDDESG